MSAADRLREDAVNLERQVSSLTYQIEDAERDIVDLRQRRDEARLHLAEARAAADFLDNTGFTVERNAAGSVTVSVDPSLADQVPA